jgi:hypothetical protein
MNESYSRTTAEEMEQWIYLLRFLRSNELAFLVDVHRRWSRFDPDRLDKIVSLLHRTFNSDESFSIVKQALTYFTRNTSLNFTYNLSIDQILKEAKKDHHLNPFRNDCPVCGSQLDTTHAKVKHCFLFQVQCFLLLVIMREHPCRIRHQFMSILILFVKTSQIFGHQKVWTAKIISTSVPDTLMNELYLKDTRVN